LRASITPGALHYDPSEWFVVPRDVINQAVAMIMSGEITSYVYDKTQNRLVETR